MKPMFFNCGTYTKVNNLILVGLVKYIDTDFVTPDNYVCRVYNPAKRRSNFMSFHELHSLLYKTIRTLDLSKPYLVDICPFKDLTYVNFIRALEAEQGVLSKLPVYDASLKCIENNNYIVVQLYENAHEGTPKLFNFDYAVVVDPDSTKAEAGFVINEKYNNFITRSDVIAPDIFDLSKAYYLSRLSLNEYTVRPKIEISKLGVFYEVNNTKREVDQYKTSTLATDLPEPPKLFINTLNNLFNRMAALVKANLLENDLVALGNKLIEATDRLQLNNLERLTCYIWLMRRLTGLLDFFLLCKIDEPCFSYKDLAKEDLKLVCQKSRMFVSYQRQTFDTYKNGGYNCLITNAKNSSDLQFSEWCNIAWCSDSDFSVILHESLFLNAECKRRELEVQFTAVVFNSCYFLPCYPEFQLATLSQVLLNLLFSSKPITWASPYYVLYENYPLRTLKNLRIDALANVSTLDLIYISQSTDYTTNFAVLASFKNLVWLSKTAISRTALTAAWQFKSMIYCPSDSAMANFLLFLKQCGFAINIINSDLSEINEIIDKARTFCFCPMLNVNAAHAPEKIEPCCIRGIPEKLSLTVQFVGTSNNTESKLLKPKDYSNGLNKLIYKMQRGIFVTLNKPDTLPAAVICERIITEDFKVRPEYADLYAIFYAEYLSCLEKIRLESAQKYAKLYLINNKVYGYVEDTVDFITLFTFLKITLSLIRCDRLKMPSLDFLTDSSIAVYFSKRVAGDLYTSCVQFKTWLTGKIAINSELYKNLELVLAYLEFQINTAEFDRVKYLAFLKAIANTPFYTLLSDTIKVISREND